jgi:hypothetical protein
MRLRFSYVSFLALVPTLAGCIGHSENLRRGDEALAKNDHARAMEGYKAVLADRNEEDSDKDAAAEGYARAWHARIAARRAAEDTELGALESSNAPALEALGKLRELAGRIRAQGDSEDAYARAKALAVRLAPAAWEAVERLVKANEYREAETGALTLASAPGMGTEYSGRLATIRSEGSAFHAARATQAAELPAAAAYHRALAAHFARARFPGAPEVIAASAVRHVLDIQEPESCASTATALRSILKDTTNGRGLPIALAIRLGRCSSSDERRSERRTSTYTENRFMGTRTETYDVTVNECRDVWKDSYRNVAVGSSTTYTQSTGAGGVVRTTPNTTVRYEQQKSRELVKECGPVTQQATRQVPIYQQFPHNVPYVYSARTLAANVEGSAIARTEGDPDVSAPVTAYASVEEEAYDREVAVDRHDVRSFSSFTADSFLASKQQQFARELEALATKARLQHAARLTREAEGLPAGPARDDRLVRAALLGSTTAQTTLRLSGERLASFIGGKDVIGSPDPSPEPPRPVAATFELPNRSTSFPGYTSSFSMEAMLGSVATGDLPSAPTTTANAPATFRESAATLGMRVAFPVLGSSFERPRGVTFLDEGALGSALVFAGSTTSEDLQASPLNLQAWASYTAMLGVRFTSLGLFAGARAHSEFMTTGYVESSGAHSVPLCARLEYRVRAYFMPRATVCARSLLGVERTSGELIVPFTGNESGLSLVGRYDALTTDVTIGSFSGESARESRTSMSNVVLGVAWTF